VLTEFEFNIVFNPGLGLLPDDLMAVLKDGNNGIFNLLRDIAKKGNVDPLVKVLIRLKSRELKVTLMNKSNGVLKLFMDQAEQKDFVPLVKVFTEFGNKPKFNQGFVLHPEDLMEILNDDGNKILNLLVDENLKALVTVFIHLISKDLYETLTKDENKI
jgi:hypothetical protein